MPSLEKKLLLHREKLLSFMICNWYSGSISSVTITFYLPKDNYYGNYEDNHEDNQDQVPINNFLNYYYNFYLN